MKPEMKKLIIANLPYLLFVYLFGKLGQTYRLAAGADLSEKLLHLADGFSLAFESAAPSFHLFDLAVGVAGAVALRLMVYCKSKNAKKYRRGVEYGSARWGGPKDIAPYIDPVFDNNILLTQTERLTMNNRPKDPKTARNKNVLVIGGSGSGKTRFFVKPNLMQCVSKDYPTSFVITDPKGSLIGEVGQLLVRCGYRVKVLNTINFSKSMRYNPFRYIHSEKDILKLVWRNWKQGQKPGNRFPFWMWPRQPRRRPKSPSRPERRRRNKRNRPSGRSLPPPRRNRKRSPRRGKNQKKWRYEECISPWKKKT